MSEERSYRRCHSTVGGDQVRSKIRVFGTYDRVASSAHGLHDDVMPDRSYPAVEALIRRVQRVAASRSDPLHILAATINMTATIGMDPYQPVEKSRFQLNGFGLIMTAKAAN